MLCLTTETKGNSTALVDRAEKSNSLNKLCHANNKINPSAFVFIIVNIATKIPLLAFLKLAFQHFCLDQNVDNLT